MTLLRRIGAAWALYLATLLSAVPLAAIVATANPMPEGACSGIGFGCSVYGWDAAGFALVIAGVPYTVVLGMLVALAGLLGRMVATGVALAGLLLPWTFTLVVLV
jgi:hypothetical protein